MLPADNRLRASGSPVWMCLKRNSFGFRQNVGAHCAVAWVSISEP